MLAPPTHTRQKCAVSIPMQFNRLMLIGFICVCWQTAVPVDAQTSGFNKLHPYHDPYEVRAVPLTKAPDFPDVPPYSGKGVQFIDGISHPQMMGGKKCIQGRYRAKDDAATVLGWYRNALQANGWTLEQQQSQRVEVAARKMNQGLSVFIRARDSSLSPYRSEFFVRYLVVPLPK